jgi:predicted transposase YdaD
VGSFLTRYDLLKADNLPSGLNDVNLKKAITILDVMNFSSEEREAYEEHLKWLRIEANTLKKAEAKGRAEGKVEGKAEGFVEGDTYRAKDIAKAMLKEGYGLELISKLTKLSITEIKNIQND